MISPHNIFHINFQSSTSFKKPEVLCSILQDTGFYSIPVSVYPSWKTIPLGCDLNLHVQHIHCFPPYLEVPTYILHIKSQVTVQSMGFLQLKIHVYVPLQLLLANMLCPALSTLYLSFYILLLHITMARYPYTSAPSCPLPHLHIYLQVQVKPPCHFGIQS